MTNVLQDWVEKLSWKQQSVIFSSLRGPDNLYCPKIKKISKWMRCVTQNNADDFSRYMVKEKLPLFENIEREIDSCSVHYVSHFLQGLEIIGYQHPDDSLAKIAYEYYREIVIKTFNLNPETKEQLEARLKDKF